MSSCCRLSFALICRLSWIHFGSKAIECSLSLSPLSHCIVPSVLPDLWFHFRNWFEWKISVPLLKMKAEVELTQKLNLLRKQRKTLKLQVKNDYKSYKTLVHGKTG